MKLLADHGSMTLREVLSPAIGYARDGHPLLARAAATIAGLADFMRAERPSSAATWMPDGQPPEAGAIFRNRALAATYTRILTEA